MVSVKLNSLHSLYCPCNESSSHIQNKISLQFSSSLPFPTLIIRQFNRLSRPNCFNEQTDVPLYSSSAFSTTMNQNAELALGSDKNELIRGAVWVGVATMASKILVFHFSIHFVWLRREFTSEEETKRTLTQFSFIRETFASKQRLVTCLFIYLTV